MRKIKAILEFGKDGYGVSFDEIPNVFGFGESVEVAKADAKEALNGFIEVLKKYGKPIPKILSKSYELEFEFDTEIGRAHV